MTAVITLDDSAVDRYADVIAAVAASLARSDVAAGAARLAPIAGERWMGRTTLAGPQGPGNVAKRPRNSTTGVAAKVFTRDGFRCSYCGGRAVPRCVLVAISDVFPEGLPYDAHYARGRIHPVYLALACEADHTLAHSRDGGGGIDNLTTMHAYCNTRKGDSLLEEIPVLEHDGGTGEWDGLISLYPGIVAAGNSHGSRHSRAGYHADWIRRYELRG